ncbi:SDR family oxidoreductase [Rhizobium sp. 1AS11]|uniref:SDR family oxidoreductase n=1 Tax=Rhizobium acaciae TaxID=2989736 RepID=UPI0022230E74|nr:SDR family oxidoreductase [Rhizobium acaciae]MCW1411929.1 SDR family oxidoreductase [Rhizobium acaciae]MCW1744079.1 SDR family oxidoreductase [Rhizobium acaciae]
MKSRKKVVVITGASSGIGQATAEAFAREGADLVIAARNAAALQAVAKTCRELGADVIVVPTDVTDAQQVKVLAEAALRLGEIDVWVSNVGVGAVGKFQNTPIEAHEQVIRANLIGHMNDAHAVLPIFLEQDYGVFINMISLGGFAAAPYATAYSASKFGLKGFSEALRGELANHPNIHICDIYPAFMDTPGISHGANYTGRKLSAPPPVYDARKVAEAVVRVSRHPKVTTTVGATADLIRVGHFFAPSLSARLMNWFMTTYFRQADSTPVTDGNLFAPSTRPGGIDGGLRSGTQRVALGAVAATVAVALGLLAVVNTYKRNSRRIQRRYRRGI